MTVNKIDVDNNEAILSLNRHEMTIIRRTLQRISNELTNDDKRFLLEMKCVDDLLKGGSFKIFLSYYREFLKEVSE